MKQTAAFGYVSGELAARTDLDPLSARGTVRLALKQAGLDASEVMATQMEVVVRRILPAELRSRGVSDAESLCVELAHSVLDIVEEEAGSEAESPEAVFERMGGA